MLSLLLGSLSVSLIATRSPSLRFPKGLRFFFSSLGHHGRWCYEYTGEHAIESGGRRGYWYSRWREGLESCALSLIGKFLTCRPFNKKAALRTLKRAWGLEEGVQLVEVGLNLFQLKFNTEFEMNSVLKGGSWSFDNQALMLLQWQVGKTVRNVKFDSVSLWVRIWEAPFDLVLPTIAEAVWSRLGTVVEVGRKQKSESQSYFMRVTVALPITKPIRRGTFLAGSDGRRH